jgi:protein-L-isoaspartate(D-aspartate) O-methyltransferase
MRNLGPSARVPELAMKALTDKHLAIFRRHMVDVIGIHVELASDEIGKAELDQRVMAAMREVPRHLFVPAQVAAAAYQDSPLPIGFDKSISQPFMVALMTDLLELEPADRVLEVGTGLGYQTAVLARLVAHVWSVEIVEEFVESAQKRLEHLGVENVSIRIGDGSRGWAEHAPYDKILVAAAAKDVPKALIEQLTPGGRLVMPLGPAGDQRLSVVRKSADENLDVRPIMAVRFGELET